MNFKRALVVQSALAACLVAAGAARAETAREKVDRYKKLIGTDRKDEAVKGLKTVLEELAPAIKASPKDADLVFQRGRVHFYLGNAAESLKDLDRAIQLDPRKPAYHFQKGLLLWFTRKPDEAEKELSAAARLGAGTKKYWKALGEFQAGRRNHQEALAALKKFMEVAPADPEGPFGYACVLMTMKQPDKARTWLEKTLELDPGHGLAHYNLGLIHQVRGECKEALPHYRAAVKAAHGDWRTRSKVIQVCSALGKTKERDAEIAALFKLRKKGGVDADFYCRDQFKRGERSVMVFEHFELKGQWGVKYVFYVFGKDRKKPLFRISLGSYESTHRVALELGTVKKGQRYYHLDGYYPGEHRTFGFFAGAPSYDETRKAVEEILDGKKKALSGSAYGR